MAHTWQPVFINLRRLVEPDTQAPKHEDIHHNKGLPASNVFVGLGSSPSTKLAKRVKPRRICIATCVCFTALKSIKFKTYTQKCGGTRTWARAFLIFRLSSRWLFLQTMQHTGNRREHIALRQNAPSWADPRKTWRAHGRAHGRAMDVRVLEYHIV